ncbi:hypothetical protein [Nitrosospira sp. Nsp1]|uniref:hypothetical protein n=1 Tax=Nitrosospira sp. Nsp1 TaxID=136547 RepID=UPI00115FB83A|nr:hypothetical protein [Nitrosospira sp. Nsp1]
MPKMLGFFIKLSVCSIPQPAVAWKKAVNSDMVPFFLAGPNGRYPVSGKINPDNSGSVLSLLSHFLVDFFVDLITPILDTPDRLS